MSSHCTMDPINCKQQIYQGFRFRGESQGKKSVVLSIQTEKEPLKTTNSGLFLPLLSLPKYIMGNTVNEFTGMWCDGMTSINKWQQRWCLCLEMQLQIPRKLHYYCDAREVLLPNYLSPTVVPNQNTYRQNNQNFNPLFLQPFFLILSIVWIANHAVNVTSCNSFAFASTPAEQISFSLVGHPAAIWFETWWQPRDRPVQIQQIKQQAAPYFVWTCLSFRYQPAASLSHFDRQAPLPSRLGVSCSDLASLDNRHQSSTASHHPSRESSIWPKPSRGNTSNDKNCQPHRSRLSTTAFHASTKEYLERGFDPRSWLGLIAEFLILIPMVFIFSTEHAVIPLFQYIQVFNHILLDGRFVCDDFFIFMIPSYC